MTKILLISQHFPPEIGAASNRINQLINQLHKRGYKIYAITSNPSYPNKKMYKNIKTQMNNIERVYRVPSISIKGLQLFERIINQIIFMFCTVIISFFVINKHKIKVMTTSSPPYLTNIVGLINSFTTSVKWILEIRDLWPDSLAAVKEVNQKSFLFRIMRAIEKLSYRRSDAIIVVTKSTKELLEQRGIPNTKLNVITNGIPSWIDMSKGNMKSKTNKYSVNYIGNLGISQNLTILVNVAEKLSSYSDIEFNVIGEGLDKRRLKNMVQEKNIKNLSFYDGVIDKDELTKWYIKSSIGIISLKQSELFTTVIPSKLFEYGALKIPILFIGSGEAAEIINKYNMGVVAGFSVESIAQKIIELKNNSRNFYDQESYRNFLRDFSWHNLINIYDRIITTVKTEIK